MGLARRSYVVRCLPVRGEEDEELVWRFSIQEAEAEADAPRDEADDASDGPDPRE